MWSSNRAVKGQMTTTMWAWFPVACKHIAYYLRWFSITSQFLLLQCEITYACVYMHLVKDCREPYHMLLSWLVGSIPNVQCMSPLKRLCSISNCIVFKSNANPLSSRSFLQISGTLVAIVKHMPAVTKEPCLKNPYTNASMVMCIHSRDR